MKTVTPIAFMIVMGCASKTGVAPREESIRHPQSDCRELPKSPIKNVNGNGRSRRRDHRFLKLPDRVVGQIGWKSPLVSATYSTSESAVAYTESKSGNLIRRVQIPKKESERIKAALADIFRTRDAGWYLCREKDNPVWEIIVSLNGEQKVFLGNAVLRDVNPLLVTIGLSDSEPIDDSPEYHFIPEGQPPIVTD